MMRNKEMTMKTHKENCIYHVVARFEERFKKEDFIYKSKKFGVVDFTNEVINAITNAPKAGIFVPGGKGDCVIFKIKYNDTKPVFVVWNKVVDCAVTVLTGEMFTNIAMRDKKKSSIPYNGYNS